MTTQITRTLLRAPPHEVYDYLTRPSRWREWHAASLGTQPPDCDSLRAGARFEENIRAAGFRRRLSWRVLDADAPTRWEAEATMSDGSTAYLLYEFSPAAGGTQFQRTLSYTVRPWRLAMVNATVGALKIRLESHRALRKLQRHFERGPA